MARIVIVAHAAELYEFIGHALAGKGHRVRILHDWRDSINRISALLPDVVIVDAANSLAGAEEFCLRIRKRYTLDRIRLLIVRPVEDSVPSQDSVFGPDAYLERPLHPRTLLHRIDELLAGKIPEKPSDAIVFRDLVIDPGSFQVSRFGRPVPVTLCEFLLLHHLASHPNEPCRRDHLLRDVFRNSAVRPRTVDVYIRQLRKKLEENPRKPRLIRSVRAHGYCFHAPDDASAKVDESGADVGVAVPTSQGGIG